MLLGEGTVVAFCGRVLALGRWNLTMSRCKCPGVPRGQPPGLAADKCITLQFRFLCLHVVSININSTSVQTKTCRHSFGDHFLIQAKVTLRVREQSTFSLDFFVCIWYHLILTQPLFKPRDVITSFETTVWYRQKILCVWESKQIVHVNNLTEICSSPTSERDSIDHIDQLESVFKKKLLLVSCNALWYRCMKYGTGYFPINDNVSNGGIINSTGLVELAYIIYLEVKEICYWGKANCLGGLEH